MSEHRFKFKMDHNESYVINHKSLRFFWAIVELETNYTNEQWKANKSKDVTIFKENIIKKNGGISKT